MNILTLLKFKPSDLHLNLPVKIDIMTIQRRY
jgi:hypothetical protein